MGKSPFRSIAFISIFVTLGGLVGPLMLATSIGHGMTAPQDAGKAGRKAKKSLPRLLDLGSKNCIPCKMMAPILEELKKEYAGTLRVEFIDVRENPDAARQHKIRLIPTQIFYDASGKELFRHQGFMSKANILAKWKDLGFGFAR